jgi:prepilin-type N-terminal cleavage/methylation domain-containing protein
MQRRARTRSGFTLVELVSVMSILSIVGLVTSYTIMESMKVYARSVPAMDATYQAHLATERMGREVRDLLNTDSITTYTATALTFDDSAGNTIAYTLSAGDLLRNGDLLATGVTSLAFDYWKSDGTAAATTDDIHLFEIDLTVQVVDQPYRVRTAVFPRILSPVSDGGGGGGGGSSGPIALWKLDESGGSTVVDSIASNDGTVHGPELNKPGAPAGATAPDFDGSNDYIEVPHSSSYLLENGTIQLWIDADDTEGDHTFFSKDSTNYDTGGHVTMRLAGDDIEVRLQSTTTSYYVTASNAVSQETWHHFAFTFGADGMKLYVDGVLRDSDPYTGGLGTTSGGTGNHEPISIGASSWGSGDLVVTPLTHYFDGIIDTVAIYDTALSATEIQALHAAGGAID